MINVFFSLSRSFILHTYTERYAATDTPRGSCNKVLEGGGRIKLFTKKQHYALLACPIINKECSSQPAHKCRH